MTFHLRVLVPVLVFASTLLCSVDARAWGRVGHAVIAERAQSQLTPAASRELAVLLDTLGVDSLSDIASWADDRRNRAEARWHYTNLPPGDCHYVRARDCPKGQCLVEQARKNIRILADSTQDDAHRANALIYVVHLVGDASQPLHSGWASDKGGNSHQIQFDGRGTSLHTFWDTDLLLAFAGTRDERAAEQRLQAAMAEQRVPNDHVASPAALVEQSCRVMNQQGFYPTGAVTSDYVDWARQVALAQLRRGSDALVAVLNAALVGKSP